MYCHMKFPTVPLSTASLETNADGVCVVFVDDGEELGLFVLDSLFIIPEGNAGTIRLADGELLGLLIRSVGVDVTVGLSVGLGNLALS